MNDGKAKRILNYLLIWRKIRTKAPTVKSLGFTNIVIKPIKRNSFFNRSKLLVIRNEYSTD